jgi:predicted ArsR family transcriptional regulator
MSRTGVLGQLRRLEAGSLVQHEPERHGVGRPRHRYDLTERAQALFPAAYDGLARGLLAAIRRVGDDELVEQIFEARRQEIAERATSHLAERLNGDRSTEARTRELAVFQDAHGYLADTVTGSDGRIRLRQHNCAIHDIASDEPAACEAELRLFRELLGEDVVRESHIASGDRACVYRVGDRQDAATEEP